MDTFHGTTIVAVHRDGKGAMAGDGQVTLGQAMIMKHGARKVRRIYHDRVIAGFAGGVADALTLIGKFEDHLGQTQGNLQRASVSLAREWRTDRMLRRLEAMLLVMDKSGLLLVSGTGEVIEPDDGIAAIGSGSGFALAAARALARHTELDPADIAREALGIAAQICVYTNDSITLEELA